MSTYNNGVKAAGTVTAAEIPSTQATDAEVTTAVSAHAALADPHTGYQKESGLLIPPQGRLTLTSATPVLAATVSASATVYYALYLGNIVPIYDTVSYTPTTFTELSNVLANSSVGSAGPAAAVAAKNYDLFVWSNAGTLTLTRGGAWNSDTARSATTENDLQRVLGIYTNLNAITNGPGAGLGTYVGTIMTDAGGATASMVYGGSASGGTAGWLGVWNLYNRVRQSARVIDTAAAWTYATATYRPANNSATNRITFVRGLNEESVHALYTCAMNTAAATTPPFGFVGVGLDATNAIATDSVAAKVIADITGVASPQAEGTTPTSRYHHLPGLGKHFLSAIEIGDGTNNTTFGGSGGMMLSAELGC